MSSQTKTSTLPLVLAKKLNNRGAFCIETGRYDRAIPTLLKALRITQQNSIKEQCCSCHYCTLEECVTFSQRRGCMTSIVTDSPLNKSFSNDTDVSNNDEGYIHKQPIRVTRQAIEKDHKMGIVLPLIINFNLALANHLTAIASENELKNRNSMLKVLKLYEVAHQFHLRENCECIHFSMIISNNIGEIHRAMNNPAKYEKCLHHLLSTMMYVVGNYQHPVDDNDSPCSLELDGFLQNASKLLLKTQCAGAA